MRSRLVSSMLVLGLALLWPLPASAQLGPYPGGLVLRDAQGDVVGGVVGIENKIVSVALTVESYVVIADWWDYNGNFYNTRNVTGSTGGWIYFTGVGCTGTPVISSSYLAVAVGGIRASVIGEVLYTAPDGTLHQSLAVQSRWANNIGDCENLSPGATVGGYYSVTSYDLAVEFPWPRYLARAPGLFCDGFGCGTTERWTGTWP